MDSLLREDFEAVIRRVLVHVLMADKKARESEYSAMQNLYFEVTGAYFYPEKIRSEIFDAQKNPGELSEMLSSLRYRLLEKDKARITAPVLPWPLQIAITTAQKKS